jgi:hypothetical protein
VNEIIQGGTLQPDTPRPQIFLKITGFLDVMISDVLLGLHFSSNKPPILGDGQYNGKGKGAIQRAPKSLKGEEV